MNSQLLVDLLESSSLPGLPILLKSKHIAVKIVWLLFGLLLSGLSIFYTIKSIQTFYDYEVVTNIDVISEPSSKFPAISFCMMSNSSDLSDVIFACYFEETDCNYTDFEMYEFPASNYICYRFNTGKNAINQSTKIMNSLQNGVYSSLTVVFNTKKLKYLGWYKSKIKAYVNIFLPIRPFFTDNENILVEGGNSIKIEREYVKKLSEPYNHCVKEETSDFVSKFFQYFIRNNKTYTQRDCLDLRIDERINQACNCSDSFGEFSESFTNAFSCISKIAYDFKLNKSLSLLECYEKCPQECDFMYYKTDVSYLGPINAENPRNIQESIKQTLISVHAYYPRLEYTLINQIAKMNEFDLVSTVGGILGLFIGLSFFTLVEIIEIAFEFFGNYLNRKLKKTRVIPRENRETPTE